VKVLALTYVNVGSYELAVIEYDNGQIRTAIGPEARNIVSKFLSEIFQCEHCRKVFHISNIGLLKIRNNETVYLCRNCVLDALKSLEFLIEKCC